MSVTKRYLYYRCCNSLWNSNQYNFNLALRKTSIILNFEEQNFKIFPNPLAKYYFNFEEKIIDVDPLGEDFLKITNFIQGRNQVQLHQSPKAILVVEKESFYTKLKQINQLSQENFLILTSSGYPTFIARRFLLEIICKSHRPVYFLTDGDSFGISIFYSYVYGSNQYPSFRLPLHACRWIGLKPSKAVKILSSVATNTSSFSSIETSEKDLIIAQNLLKNNVFLKNFPKVEKELKFIIEKKVKFELEVLAELSNQDILRFIEKNVGREFEKCLDYKNVEEGFFDFPKRGAALEDRIEEIKVQKDESTKVEKVEKEGKVEAEEVKEVKKDVEIDKYVHPHTTVTIKNFNNSKFFKANMLKFHQKNTKFSNKAQDFKKRSIFCTNHLWTGKISRHEFHEGEMSFKKLKKFHESSKNREMRSMIAYKRLDEEINKIN